MEKVIETKSTGNAKNDYSGLTEVNNIQHIGEIFKPLKDDVLKEIVG
ncbi:hypothetical protein [Suttonella ornithocola]|nr:hypothetical protein [Suttonella ornithocola]